MKIKEIVAALERFAPLPLQDGFDNAGLQVGLTEEEVTGALLCLDVTEAVVDEAIALGFNLIVSHHPLLFKPLKRISGRNYIERCVMKALRNGIAIYSAHTNLDNAPHGVNAKIAAKLGLTRLQILAPKEANLLKLVTFVPVAQAEEVREALFAAGCGSIGNYDACSYNVQGEGTFRAGAGTHPFCGKEGELHTEKEIRVETVLPSFKRNQAIAALLEAHPYEEPAYDVYALQNEWQQAGSGIVGELPEEESEIDFLQRLKRTFEVGCVKHGRLTGKTIRKVALCGGAGAFLLPNALQAQADVYITGEMHYHDYFDYETLMLVAEIGHYESEQYTKELFYDFFTQQYPSMKVQITTINTNPIQYL